MTRPTAHDAEEQTPQARGSTQIAGWRLTGPELFGLVLAVVCATLFVYIAQEVIAEREWARLDALGTQWVQGRSTAFLTVVMRGVSELHNTLPISAVIALLAVFFAMRRRWKDLILLLAAVPLGMLLNVAMKHTFLRARPSAGPLSDLLESYSFPSGHVAASTLLYGFLVVLVFHETERPSLRVLALASAVLAVVSVAVSRVYLGVHYTTDVAAAAVEALGWLFLCWSIVRFSARHACLDLPRREHQANSGSSEST